MEKSRITFPDFMRIQWRELCDQRPQLLDVAKVMDDFWDNGRTSDVLNISMPTRFGKSLLSTTFSVYLLTRDTRTRILRASYSADLAESFSFQVRNQLTAFCEKVGIPLHTDGTRNRWRIAGNSMDNHAGVGVGGSITGFGFDIAIIDDTAKNMQDAMSAAYRRSLTSFRDSVLIGRMEGRKKIVNVGTRWTVNDWFSLWPDAHTYRLQAMDDSGRSCCEAWKTTEELAIERNRVSSDVWNAQYQQQPTATGRVVLFEDWHPVTDAVPDDGDDYIICDPSTEYGADYFTAFHYRRKNGLVYLVDGFARKKASPEDVAEWIRCREYSVCWCESNGVGASVIRRLRECGVRGVAAFSTTSDKYSRAYVQRDNLTNYLRIGDGCDAGVVRELLREAEVFPCTGDDVHDDLLDNVVMFFERLRMF